MHLARGGGHALRREAQFLQYQFAGGRGAEAIDAQGHAQVADALGAIDRTVVHAFARALEEAGIPCMVIPVDPVDGRTWDEERIRDLMGRFLDDRVAPHAKAMRG